MAAVFPKLTPLPPTLLDEIASANLDNRFAACVAISSGIWGHGFTGCRNDAERAEWLARLGEYFMLARNAWASIPLDNDGFLETTFPPGASSITGSAPGRICNPRDTNQPQRANGTPPPPQCSPRRSPIEQGSDSRRLSTIPTPS